jgi:peroxiredoxin
VEKPDTFLGNYAPDFELPGIDEAVYHLASYLKNNRGVAVIFMCNHCPYVGLYLERLKQIQSEFQAQGFTLIGINSNDATQYVEDSFEKMKTFAEQKQLNFPYLWDSNQDVAHSFGAQKTPEVFLLDNTGILRYTGAIDDNPQEPEAVQAHYLRDAIAAVVKGEAVTPASTEAIGCSLKWAKNET